MTPGYRVCLVIEFTEDVEGRVPWVEKRREVLGIADDTGSLSSISAEKWAHKFVEGVMKDRKDRTVPGWMDNT